MNALAHILQEAVAQRLGWALLHFLWQGAAIGLIFAGGMRLLRNRSANARYLLGCAAMCSMVGAVALTIGFQSTAVDGVSSHGNRQNHSSTTPSEPAAVVAESMPETGTTAHVLHGSASPYYVRTLRPMMPLIVATWLAGVCLLSIRLASGWAGVQLLRFRKTEPAEPTWAAAVARLRRQLQISRPVGMLKSYLVEVPTVIGWLRPLILMPASTLSGLTPAQVEMILAHELAHIRRHDYLVNLLQTVIETLLFYHPVVWWVSRCIREEREHCCDDVAVEICKSPAVYARTLAALEDLRSASRKLALAATGRPLLRRVARLAGVDAPVNRSFVGLWTIAVPVVFAAVLLAAREQPGLPMRGKTNEVATLPLEPRKGFVWRTNGAHRIEMTTERASIIDKLDTLFLENVEFQNAPLGHVAAWLSIESRKADPEKRGVNVMIYPGSSALRHEAGNPGDPALSLEERMDAAAADAAAKIDGKPRNIDAFPITIHPRIDRVRLRDILDEILQSSGARIKFSVTDVGVAFGWHSEISQLFTNERVVETDLPPTLLPTDSPGGRSKDAPRLYTRSFRIGPGRGDDVIKRLTDEFPFLTLAGRQAFFNEQLSMLIVRATREELRELEMKADTLTRTPEQLTLQVRLAEVTEDPEIGAGIKLLDFATPVGGRIATDALENVSTNVVIRKHPERGDLEENILVRGGRFAPGTTILTEPECEAALNALQQKAGTDLLTAPTVTTLSGRQTQVKITETKNIVTQSRTAADGTVSHITEPFEVGPVVDIVPEVLGDERTIQLRVTGGAKEFLGYHREPDSAITNGIPVFRQRQTTTSARVWDGQTLVFSPGVIKVEQRTKDKVPVLGDMPVLGRIFRSEHTNYIHKRLFFFVSPVLIDAAGNRIHNIEEMPFATNSVPEQRRK